MLPAFLKKEISSYLVIIDCFDYLIKKRLEMNSGALKTEALDTILMLLCCELDSLANNNVDHQTTLTQFFQSMYF